MYGRGASDLYHETHKTQRGATCSSKTDLPTPPPTRRGSQSKQDVPRNIPRPEQPSVRIKPCVRGVFSVESSK